MAKKRGAKKAPKKAGNSLTSKVKALNDLMDKRGVTIIDVKFADMLGTWQHFSITRNEFGEGIFTEGLGFDGSSIRGFQTIDESDMLVVPDIDTALMDPATQHPTLSFICNIKDPITGESYGKDPRYVAQKCEAYVKKTGGTFRSDV